MIPALFYAWQAANPGTGDVPPLPTFSTVPHCPRDLGDGDVVVCGSIDQGRYRLNPRPPNDQPGPGGEPKAEVSLGGGTLGVTARQGNVGGIVSNRATLTWKLTF